MDVALTAMILASGRPWWQVRYRDGRVVSEWESVGGPPHLPLAEVGAGSRWEDLDRRGLIGIRLLCPDGTAAALEAKEDRKLFQFKLGGLSATTGGPHRHWCDAAVIGAVLDSEGRCVCRAWETGPRRLVAFEDNVHDMRYHAIGRLGLDNLGIAV